MTSVLVTGGAGFVGSILVQALLPSWAPELGVRRVTVLDNFRHGVPSLAHICHDPALDIVRGDARDATTMAWLLKDADALIPLAAIVGAPACDADVQGATSTNVGAIRTAVSLMSKDQRILIPITNSGYGIGDPGQECTEISPLRPISLYGRTKVEAEEAVLARGNAVSFRLATVFGMSPRMRLDLLVNDFVHRAVTDRAVVLFEAGFKRNYVHVRDVARVFLHGLEHFETMRDQVFNVGLSDANLSKRELCEQIAQHVPGFVYIEAPVGEDPDKRDYVVSNAKIEATGWRPAYSLDDGIRELIKGLRMIRNSRYGNA